MATLILTIKKLLLIAFLLVSFVGFSQRTHILDANFRAVLQSKYNITANAGDSILTSEAEAITTLDVGRKNSIRSKNSGKLFFSQI